MTLPSTYEDVLEELLSNDDCTKVIHKKPSPIPKPTRMTKYYHANCHAFNYPVGPNIKNVTKACKALQEKMILVIGRSTRVQLWCRGSSGAIIAALVSQGFSDVKIIHVKKPGETSHSAGIRSEKGYMNVMIDDFTDSGRTLNQIYEVMQNNSTPVDLLCILANVTLPILDFVPPKVISDSIRTIEYGYLRRRSGLLKY